ncbi:hypothetical protein J3B02_003938 [Coemansia erecta]|uniref:Pentatricopeptide repeat-containing protein n=1 Tax=Coemansia asiatica TaxID=1052880 RepID=A0A9W7XRL0_9FUNG|nr:hypothetical protein LPJ64_000655 [Coemansia asiatica]KAJ2848506.1 hypothetical protein J3B02_003938 [Coemansia erecta]
MLGFLHRMLAGTGLAARLARNMHTVRPFRQLRKKALIQNDKMVGLLSASAHKHDIQAAWYWYQRLLRRLRQEKTQSSFRVTTDTRVLSRQQDRSISAHNIHGSILTCLNTHGLFCYGPKQLTALSDMVKQVLENLFSSGGKLTGKELVEILNIFAAAKQQEMVDRIWQYVALSRMPLDTASYNAYAGANILAKQYDRAFEVIREISAVGLQPNTYTKVLMIRLYGLTGDLNAARRVFDFVHQSVAGHASYSRLPDYISEANELGHCGPNVSVYTEMISVLGMNGLMDEMRELFLKLSGLPIDLPLNQITADIVADARRLDYQRMRPTIDTFHQLIRWHAQYWDIDTATRYIHLMPVFGIDPVPKSFKLIVTPENAARNLDKCVELAAGMREMGLEVPGSITRILGKARDKIEEMDEMVRVSMGQRSLVFGQPAAPESNDPASPIL